MAEIRLHAAVDAMVLQRQLAANEYIALERRDPRQLPDHVRSLTALLIDLKDHVYGKVPLPIFNGHYESTRRMLETLKALENGFSHYRDRPEAGGTKRAEISEEVLSEMIKAKMTDGQIGSALGCSAKTISRRRNELGLHRRAAMHGTPQAVIRGHIMQFLAQQNEPSIGVEMARGHLREQGVAHTREDVRDLMRNMNPEQYAARAAETTRRREYYVPFINSLWHMDGHHKLIRWKFVIHGAIDGKSHLVTFLGASDNNRSDTVLALFQDAVGTWGWPQRVRADYGGENLGVKEAMEERRGLNCGAFLQGPSTANQRIERLWVNVRQGLCDKYIMIFRTLEAENHLCSSDPVHLYCLHFVYLPMIKAALNTWRASWNSHSMSTPGLGGMTPLGQWYTGVIGAAQNGFYINYRAWDDDEEEERLWRAYGEQERLDDHWNGFDAMNVANYPVRHNGPGDVRQPRYDDQHVQIDHFGDNLPLELYDKDFLRKLELLFPHTPPTQADSGQDRFVRLLKYIETYLYENHRDFVVRQL
ncbi:hypothetical protein QFC21_005469 [Naganishia friedmannii]|uniref:Uncharacterized protein n=1 Tax=Naganishia friedmannii TaxID=89922 RepID=A0ACC2V967_9TREE|nr:hypothetical protein QFC21_005469 [Naganishia friedmannii]